MVSRNTTLVPSLRLRFGLVCEAGLSAGMRRERVPPKEKESKKKIDSANFLICQNFHSQKYGYLRGM